MKTATIPSLRVDPALREAAESVLHEGESLSSFMEESLQANISRRRMQREFIARGLASYEEAQRTGGYFSSDHVQAELEDMLREAQAKEAHR
ncbi:YlcI/YnfO family protein [Dyella choica]|uniref:Prevent-host-death protein n=1 Tax=Dyella choica TaxID=1927959 RepID=A0A432M390_9GAMM|nr:YlcI/YnfO family protein [Dyella choica]RUL72927.1 prevent-host-death protein [Dyella choica]